jgi:ectoine hydroxylase-related dioxygenase (phytanoyl-CoA dioxygenase family)
MNEANNPADKNRFFGSVSKNLLFLKQLTSKLNELFENDDINASIIKSENGSKMQDPHIDWNNLLVQKCERCDIPNFALYALDDDTTIEIWNESHKLFLEKHFPKKPIFRETIKLNKGDIIIWKACFVHAGSAYQKENWRLLFTIGINTLYKKAKDMNCHLLG